jgi:hypothetical protein
VIAQGAKQHVHRSRFLLVIMPSTRACNTLNRSVCLPRQAGLWQGNHDGLASFMAATGQAALPEAAALSGLSLRAELRLCQAAGQFRRALACLAALAASATERSAVMALPSWRRAAAESLPCTSITPRAPLFWPQFAAVMKYGICSPMLCSSP